MGKTKDRLIEIIETNENINSFEEAIEHIISEAEFIRDSTREEADLKKWEDNN